MLQRKEPHVVHRTWQGLEAYQHVTPQLCVAVGLTLQHLFSNQTTTTCFHMRSLVRKADKQGCYPNSMVRTALACRKVPDYCRPHMRCYHGRRRLIYRLSIFCRPNGMTCDPGANAW